MCQSLVEGPSGSPPTAALLPLRPHGRLGIGCIVSQNNGKLLSQANIAIGQMMQAYLDGDAGTREMVGRWIGPTKVSNFYSPPTLWTPPVIRFRPF